YFLAFSFSSGEFSISIESLAMEVINCLMRCPILQRYAPSAFHFDDVVVTTPILKQRLRKCRDNGQLASSPVFIQGDAHAYWLCTRVNK
ncbi:TPA: hypothetical protein ACH5XT_004548, partial [Escherichia coli]